MTVPAPPSDHAPAPPGAGAPGDPATMGWRTDPWQRHELRFFDGERWTEHVANGGLAGIDTTPVADLERSRPSTRLATLPAEGPGPHVIDGPPPDGTVDDPLLLLTGPGETGERALFSADDVPVGRVVVPRRRWPSRLLALFAVPAEAPPTALEVRDAEGRLVVRLSRPRGRMAPVVDLDVPAGPRGKVSASGVRRGLDAEVAAAGTVVGRLAEGTGPVRLEVRDREGRAVARVSDVWDVPGGRRHIPPDSSLIDRRGVAGGPGGTDDVTNGVAGPDPGDRPVADHGMARLLLGALLSPVLLLPPEPPPPGPPARPGHVGRSPLTGWPG